MHLKVLEKQEVKPKAGRRKEIINAGAETHEIEPKRTVKESVKQRAGSGEM
jgi:hypothetical protein